MKSWRDYSNQLFCQENYICRHWTRHDTELLSNRLYHSKIAFAVLLIFRYLFVVWFDRDLTWLFESIVSSTELHLQNFWTRHDTVWLFQSIVSSKRLHMRCYWLSDTSSLYDLIVICCTTCLWSMIISCQCRCLISWYVNLAKFWRSSLFSFSLNSLREQDDVWIYYTINSFLKYLYIVCFDCFESWTLLFEFQKLRTMMSLMSYALQFILSWAINCLSIVLCIIKKIMKLCCVRDLLRSFAYFMLYFPIVCYEIHVKLAHINARWIEMTTYRVIYDEMFVCKFLIHARMSVLCRDVCSDSYLAIYDRVCMFVIWFLCMLNSNEMSWQLIYISLPTCRITWRN